MRSYQITEYCHRTVAGHIQEGDCCIDATAGNGNDTEFLCRQVGNHGKVYAFDIQQEALEHTQRRLADNELAGQAELILDGHERMCEYVSEKVSAVMFNFGYLPGGDHGISTKAETSIQAVEAGLKLLKKGGIMSLCIYSGKDSGYEEKNRMLEYLRSIDPGKYLVIVCSYFNRENDPPIPAFVIRMKE